MPRRRLLLPFYLLLLVGAFAFAGLCAWPTWQEYRQATAAESRAKASLTKSEAELHAREKILDRLRNDPAYVELIIRRRLGYTRPDEMVFKFEP